MATAAVAQDNRSVDFDRTVGNWRIVGDRQLGTCLTTPLSSSNGASLSIASPANDAALTFSLQSEAWMSLKNEESSRLWAHFLTRGKITDSWNLDVVSRNDGKIKPTILFTIERAKNDGASFIDQFSAADQIAFFRDKVPVAIFDLKGSSAAVNQLLACRAILRADPSFDPFAG
jgi:hypothetical protein